jgi:hypothetical protein
MRHDELNEFYIERILPRYTPEKCEIQEMVGMGRGGEERRMLQ